jgi:hypothetical protein
MFSGQNYTVGEVDAKMQSNHSQKGKLNDMLPIETFKMREELALRREKAVLSAVRYVR